MWVVVARENWKELSQVMEYVQSGWAKSRRQRKPGGEEPTRGVRRTLVWWGGRRKHSSAGGHRLRGRTGLEELQRQRSWGRNPIEGLLQLTFPRVAWASLYPCRYGYFHSIGGLPQHTLQCGAASDRGSCMLGRCRAEEHIWFRDHPTPLTDRSLFHLASASISPLVVTLSHEDRTNSSWLNKKWEFNGLLNWL